MTTPPPEDGDGEDSAMAGARKNSTKGVKKRFHPHFRYYLKEKVLKAVTQKGKEEPTSTQSGTIAEAVLALFDFLEKSVEDISDVLSRFARAFNVRHSP